MTTVLVARLFESGGNCTMLGVTKLPILRSIDAYLVLLLVLSLFVLAPLFAPGYFYDAHDGRHSVFYLMQFDAAIRDGALWPRWAMHHIQGYGYPTFVIQAPLGFYVGELFVLLGAGYTLAAKLTWAVGFLVGGVGMYRLVMHWLRRMVDGDWAAAATVHLAAVVAGLLYTYIPYHLVGIYVRAALNDTLLFAWFPWVFLAFDHLIDQGLSPDWPRRFAIALFCLAGTLLTHTFALVSFAPLLVSFVLFRLWQAWRQGGAGEKMGGREDRRTGGREDGRSVLAVRLVQRTMLAGGAGIGALLLCATFILPLLVEGKHLDAQVYQTGTYLYEHHFVPTGQFFNPFWGYGFSDDPTGVNDGMGFQVGLVVLLLGTVALFILSRSAQPQRQHDLLRVMGYLALISLILLFLMTPAAAPIWAAITAVQVIQFPWRLLALVAFTMSALGGLTAWVLVDTVGPLKHVRAQQEAGGGLVLLGLLAIFASYPYIGAQLQPVEPWREDGRAIFRFEQEHPDMIAFTEYVQQPFTESPMTAAYASEAYAEDYSDDGLLARLAIINGSGEIVSQYSRGSSAGGIVRADDPITLRIHEFYFPGWRVQVDGQPVAHRVSDPAGLIEVDVPAGEHRIDARMGWTPIRRTGTIISWLTFVVVVILWCGQRFSSTRQSKS